MSSALAVVTIHGMGWQEAQYSAGLKAELQSRLRNAGSDPDRVDFHEIHWAKITEEPQRDYLEKARRQTDLDYVALRRFVVSSLGDPAAYSRHGEIESSTYEQIHDLVRDELATVADQAGAETPVVVIAHSLGGHIMSNYIWDLQSGYAQPEGSGTLEAMTSLAGFITFGTNIPLFALAHRVRKPIAFPGSALPVRIKRRARAQLLRPRRYPRLPPPRVPVGA